MNAQAIHFHRGALSLLPDTPWLGGCVASNDRGELIAISEPFQVPDAATPCDILTDGPCRLAVELLAADDLVGPCTWHALQRTTPRRLDSVKLLRPACSATVSRLPPGRWRMVLRRLDRGETTLAVAAAFQFQSTPLDSEAPHHVLA